MALLQLQDFSVSFNTPNGLFKAVDKVNLSIENGEIMALIGESGSGKSVASQSICRLLPQAIIEGQAIIDTGQNKINLVSANEEQLRKIRSKHISYIFQEPMTALNPLLRCGEQILENFDGEKGKNELEALLKKVELSDADRIARSYPHELSGGQRQRVMIAMALASSPALLIADEPTTALDLAVQTEVLSLLKRLAKDQNLAVLFITHDLMSLKEFADNIAVIYKGQIVETGNGESLLKNPQHAYTRALLESRASYEKKGTRLSEISDILGADLSPQMQKVHMVAPTDDILLEVRDLYKWHEKKSLFKHSRTEVLRNISFDIHKGDVLGLIGESGSGKSTIAKILLKIWQQNQGQVLYKGKALQSVNDLYKHVQLVFQDPYSSLNPKHKIGNAILEVLTKHSNKPSKSKVNELLETVGLAADSYSKYPHEFSGGQRQRICIAKALACEPEILVLDEAVSALDVSVQAKILNLLNDLKELKGLTYLLISHDMNVVSYFCNKILVLRNGSIVDYGLTDDLIHAPSSDYTASLLKHSIL